MEKLDNLENLENLEPKRGFFQEIVRFTADGKIKSLDFMYAFALGIALLFVYYFVGNWITLAFEAWFPGLGRGLLNVLDIGVPALLCAALFCGLFLLIKNKVIVPLSFCVALAFILVVIIAMLIQYSADMRELLLPVVAYLFLLPVGFGALCVFVLSALCRRRRRARKAK